MNKLMMCVMWLSLGNILAFFQLQGQFMDKLPEWVKSPWFVFAVGAPVSIMFWIATRLSYEHFGFFWNIRLMGFGLGTIIFGILTWSVLHQAPTLKTIICLLLAAAIVLIQITNVAE
jgi:uncharacterized membrane protein